MKKHSVLKNEPGIREGMFRDIYLGHTINKKGHYYRLL